MLRASRTIQIPESELVEQFIHAGGPGGQHVNKTATAVQLRFSVTNSPSLPEATRARLLRLAENRINQDGELLIEARQHRSQQRNREDARERLAGLIARAAKPTKRRKPTRPSRAAKARRIDRKKQRGRKKQLRTPPGSDE